MSFLGFGIDKLSKVLHIHKIIEALLAYLLAQFFMEIEEYFVYQACKLLPQFKLYTWCISLSVLLFNAVTVFCYYQFYCFQDTQKLTFFTEFVNTEGFSAQICAATSPLRELIDSLLPWFRYQEWTWLAIGECKHTFTTFTVFV